MGRVVLGSFVAAIVCFVWGAVFWMSPLSDGAHARAPDGPAVADQLDAQLPETGTYLIPQPSVEREEQNRRQEEGPVMMIHFQKHGVDAMSAQTFVGGFMQMWATFFLVGLLMWMVVGRLPTWSDRTGFVAVFGMALVLWTRLGDIIWFHIPSEFTTMVGIYDLLAFVLGGGALALIVTPPESEEEDAREPEAPEPESRLRGAEPETGEETADRDEETADDDQDHDHEEDETADHDDEEDETADHDEETADDEDDDQPADDEEEEGGTADQDEDEEDETAEDEADKWEVAAEAVDEDDADDEKKNE